MGVFLFEGNGGTEDHRGILSGKVYDTLYGGGEIQIKMWKDDNVVKFFEMVYDTYLGLKKSRQISHGTDGVWDGGKLVDNFILGGGLYVMNFVLPLYR